MEDLFNANKSILKSMVLDEEKLITYVSISKDLCVHINTGKILLQRIVEHIRKENPDLTLSVNYILCGAVENNNARTIICSEEELCKIKQSFNNKFFEHIYSVTKGHHTIDTAAYLTVNKFEDFALCSGLIKSQQCEKRTLDEIGDLKLKSSSQDVIIPEKSKSLPASVKKIKEEKNITKNNQSKVKPISKGIGSQSEPILKQEIISPKKEVVHLEKSNSKVKTGPINGQKTQKGIAGFFNKTNGGSNKKEVHNGKETKNKTETTSVKSEKMEVEEVLPVLPKFSEERQKNGSNKMLDQIKRTSKLDKKRKRVLHVSDSESDNEINDPFVEQPDEEQNHIVTNDSEDEIASTPTVNNIVIKSGIVNPKKRRKVVDKTYTDEDGYMLTKKVEVYESCSDNEEEAQNQKKSMQVEIKSEVSPRGKTSAPKKKNSPPQRGKQSTLTSFFKKM